MYIRVSDGSNATYTGLDLTNIEQWRVSLGARSVSQSSTPGTLQDARNAYGTLPLSLTLMVRGGTKEKNRALCSRIISRLQGKVEVGELDGYEDVVFIGSVKSYSINAQCARWFTMTIVIECEKWITGALPITTEWAVDADTCYYAMTEYDVEAGETTSMYLLGKYGAEVYTVTHEGGTYHIYDETGTEVDELEFSDGQGGIELIMPVADPFGPSTEGGSVVIDGGNFEFRPEFSSSGSSHTVTIRERHSGDITPGLIPTPLSLRIKATGSVNTLKITASSQDTPENAWRMELRNLLTGYEFIVSAPHPGSDETFGFTLTDGSGNKVDPDNIVKNITRWPVFAGGTMRIDIYGSSAGSGEIEFEFTMPALQAL